MTYFQRNTFASVLLILSPGIFAQETALPPVENPYENWYQVEMLIFKRADNGSDFDKETWPKSLSLAYPPKVQHLIDPNAPEPQQPEPLQQEPPVAEEQASEATEHALADAALSKHQPYTLLEKERFLIENVERAVARERGLKILFHQSWLQPIAGLDDAPALIINGGEKFGEHSELEGSVKLSLSRYLHIHTDLWLTQFVANYGQKIDHWPDLPTQPQALQPVDMALEDVDLNAPLTSLNADKAAGFELSMEQPNQGFDGNNMGVFTDFSYMTERPFLINEIITLTQKRRMRSDELHYIDHPRMGILIKISAFSGSEKSQ
ncbi:Peptidoglycan-binding protein, CsiV [Alteromonadaceae bacterium Bs31]|nr:Peptidoglycan-binding protein, CsiV [Alteromonadaceae bacterium Bs31]